MEYKYKISVVIPVYNVEKYLSATIDNVIKQTIGFKKNIQIILINDGSTDNSEKICLKYNKRYPNNIIYYSKQNEGVSKTRNYAMEFIEGKYVSFLDSDDIIDKDAFKKAIKMLEEREEIDVATLRLKFFEASNNYHWLDYKFDSDRIIDINEEPENIVLHIGPSIIRSTVLKKYKFDINLKISEDTKLLYQIILEKEKYGIISSSNYYYRKRKNGSSAIQTSREDESWYINSFEYCYDFLIDLSIKKYGKVIPYVQHFIMYDIQWRMKAKISDKLTVDQRKKYVEKIRSYLKIIDDEIIIFQKYLNMNYKILAFKAKYEDDLVNNLKYGQDGIYIGDILFVNYNDILNNVELCSIRNKALVLEGNVFLDIIPFDLYYKINGKERVKIETYNRNKVYNIFNDLYKTAGSSYIIKIPLKDVKTIEIEIEIDRKFYVIKNVYSHFSRVNNFKVGYYYDKKYLITKDYNKERLFVLYKPSKLKLIWKELYYLAYLILNRRKIKVAIQRIVYWITKPFIPKTIWLFADREFMARDSAEEVFKYANLQKNTDKRTTYFAVDKNSEDYQRMKKYGKVVGYHTLKYKLLFLNAKYLISSHADAYVNNEFGDSRKFYIDLYKFKYIYLTHGVLLHDSSSWLNRINKNIELNVVTSPMEYESILNGNYYFKPEQLIKTGLPRNDKLFDNNIKEEKKILIMASWRSKLAGPVIKFSQKRAYNPKFKDSEYYNFYNKLFNDKRLQTVLKKYNYKIKFCIHPSFRAQLKDFIENDFVEIAIDVDSQYETISSKMLITDYSSAACDFAYLRKPVIYANFDLDHIYDIHYYNKGYFDYDVHGFGPNCKTYEDTIEKIIQTIENDCIMEEKYKKRCDEFFYYNDNNAAKRVYEAIIEHEDNNK